MTGPLSGVRIIEFAGLGPGPFAAMLLADMGADVIRIDRADAPNRPQPLNPILRGRRSITVDLKSPGGVEIAHRLINSADVLIEGFRPGVMERLGLGPEAFSGSNPRLVYGRMTGWGQEGPLADRAGHDLNYIAIAGILDPIGRAGAAPTPPLNLVGDYGGGALYLAFGIVCALLSARESGHGQVVDAAIVDGAASLSTTFQWFVSHGDWQEQRGTNLLDSGAPYYDVYETSDGKYVSIAALEPKFYAELRTVLGLTGPEWEGRTRKDWPKLRLRLEEVFASRTREQWCEVFAGSDACFAPVLSLREAREDRHIRARGTLIEEGGVVQPAPAPRLSRTPAQIRRPPTPPGEDTIEILAELGLSTAEVDRLADAGALGRRVEP